MFIPLAKLSSDGRASLELFEDRAGRGRATDGLLQKKAPPGLVHHSEGKLGVQYTSLSFEEKLKEIGITPSRGREGSAPDNA